MFRAEQVKIKRLQSGLQSLADVERVKRGAMPVIGNLATVYLRWPSMQGNAAVQFLDKGDKLGPFSSRINIIGINTDGIGVTQMILGRAGKIKDVTHSLSLEDLIDMRTQQGSSPIRSLPDGVVLPAQDDYDRLITELEHADADRDLIEAYIPAGRNEK